MPSRVHRHPGDTPAHRHPGGTPAPGPDRKGNVLIIICILCVLICAAVFSLGYLTKTDVTTSSNMLRENLATNIAESIAAQIEGQVNAGPWTQRFWFMEAVARGDVVDGPTLLSFDTTTPYVNLSKDSLAAGSYSFTGVVKDLDGELRQYRLYLEVTVRGERYAYSWDKVWDQSLLAGMNRDSTQVDKPLEDGEGSTAPTDELIEQIKTRVADAPPPDKSGTVQATRLKRLKKNKKSFSATTVMPDPTSAPKIPPQI